MIREAFLKKFVMTKERFQIFHKNWLEKEEKRGHTTVFTSAFT